MRSAAPLTWRKPCPRLQEESLERINPQIVEAFLARMALAKFIKLGAHAAGDGIFMLGPGPRPELADAAGIRDPVLIATSGSALEQAQVAGADVSSAVTLGPGRMPSEGSWMQEQMRLVGSYSRGAAARSDVNYGLRSVRI